jgi:hypothetical protein
MTPTDDLRWIVTAVYRGDLGLIDIEFHIEELNELHDLIERGPDWNCIERISIALNPNRRAYDDTIEESLQR